MSEQRVSPVPVRDIARTALRPRWLGVLGAVIVLCIAFAGLGRWQLDVARAKGQHHHTTRVTAPLDSVVQPQQTFRNDLVARPVSVSGEYVGGKQLLVSGQQLDGVKGFWVLSALRVPSGALLPVVRGFVSSAQGAAGATTPGLAPPPGTVSLTGLLEPPDPTPSGGDGPDVPAGQVPAADTADVVNLWGSPIYNVLLFPTSAEPAPVPLVTVPAPPAGDGGGFNLRNAAYAVQWWLFGIFALLLWWRMVRQDTIELAAAAAARPAETTETKELSAT